MAKITYLNKVNNTTSALPTINKAGADEFNEIKTSVNALYCMITSDGQEIIVQTESDLPAAVNGYHQIPANTVLNFKVQSLTLTNGLEFLGLAMIKGSSSETTFLNGAISNQSFIKTAFSLPIQNISFTVNGVGSSIFEINTDGIGKAFDWLFINTFGDAKIGNIGTTSNMTLFSCAFFNTGSGFTFNGTIATIAISQCLFSGMTTALEISATAVVTRRFRIIYSSLVVFGGNIGINVNVAAGMPVSSYILDHVNFSGGSTYLVGVQFDDNKSLFDDCVGIPNSASIGALYMQDNTVPTSIPVINTYYKVLGTTIPLDINQRFTHSNNRLTYVGAIEEVFSISGTISATSGNNNVVQVTIFENGIASVGFDSKGTAGNSGRAESLPFFWIGKLAQGDFLELFVRNLTSTTNIIAESLFYSVKQL
jgi:hypothetical protein